MVPANIGTRGDTFHRLIAAPRTFRSLWNHWIRERISLSVNWLHAENGSLYNISDSPTGTQLE